MDLLPSLRDPRHLQPLRRRLADRSSRVGGSRRATHRRHRGEGKHCSRDPHAPCRSWHQYAIETRRRAPHRPRSRQIPQPPARVGRQSVLRGAVQNTEVPTRLPRSLRLDRGCSCSLPEVLPLVQQRTPPRRYRLDGSGCRPPRNRYSAEQATCHHDRRRIRSSSNPLQGRRPEAASTSHCRLDQPTEKGTGTSPNQNRLLTKLMTSGVSMSLTRSGATVQPLTKG